MATGNTSKPPQEIASEPPARRDSDTRRRSHGQAPSGPTQFSGPKTQSSADIVYTRLHAAIAAMELRPGMLISETSLTEEFGVSRTPGREALQRLAKEKLVEIVPKSGTYVGRIPVSALIEAMAARRALETMILRKAVERISPSQVIEFRTSLHRQRALADTGDLEAFHDEDEAFHAAFASAAGYPGIWEIIRSVKIQVDRYRQLTLPQEGRLEMVIREHTGIVDAIEARNPDRAVQCMESHLDKLQLDIEVFGQKWPDYFIHDRSLDD